MGILTPRRLQLIGCGLVLLLAAGCGGAGKQADSQPGQPASAVQPPAATTPEPRPVKGAPAPEIIAKDVKTGELVRLSDMKGQVVMVNFWATWCGPCRVEMPHMEALSQEMKGKLRILAVGGDPRESAQTLASFAESLGLTFTVGHDFGSAARTYRALGLPTSYFIDKNGIVQERWQGAMTLEQMRTLVANTEAAATP